MIPFIQSGSYPVRAGNFVRPLDIDEVSFRSGPERDYLTAGQEIAPVDLEAFGVGTANDPGAGRRRGVVVVLAGVLGALLTSIAIFRDNKRIRIRRTRILRIRGVVRRGIQ